MIVWRRRVLELGATWVLLLGATYSLLLVAACSRNVPGAAGGLGLMAQAVYPWVVIATGALTLGFADVLRGSLLLAPVLYGTWSGMQASRCRRRGMCEGGTRR